MVKPLLNGRTRDDREANYGPSFRKLRYGLLLLVSIKIPNFEEDTSNFQNMTFVNMYRLSKIARGLGINFDRSKIAEKIYKEMEDKGEVRKIITEDNKTFVTLTKKGEQALSEKLECLEILNEKFYSQPLLQNLCVPSTSEERKSKGLKSPGTSKDEIMIENLIAKISS